MASFLPVHDTTNTSAKKRRERKVHRYDTAEERKAAKRADARAYYARKQAARRARLDVPPVLEPGSEMQGGKGGTKEVRGAQDGTELAKVNKKTQQEKALGSSWQEALTEAGYPPELDPNIDPLLQDTTRKK